MAHTVLSYKDRHVPVVESPVIAIGYMLFHEAILTATTPEDTERFQRFTEDFFRTTCGVGCTKLRLDAILQGDPKKELEFLTFVDLVRERLLEFGKEVPPEYVNRVMAIYERDWKDQSWPTPWLHKVLGFVETLIRGGRLPGPGWLGQIRSGTWISNRSRRRRRW